MKLNYVLRLLKGKVSKGIIFGLGKGILTFGLIISSLGQSIGQVYSHDFGTTTISTHPYTVAPGVIAANLSGSSWSNSTNTWTSFNGSSGQAIALNNSSGTPTITLTFNVASGYQLAITSFNFWRQRSNTGATNWSMTINGITVGSGTAPTSGSAIGVTNVSNAVSGQTGTITIVLSLSGASGSGTFRLDDFTLNGTVSAVTPTIVRSSPSQIASGNISQGSTSNILSAFQAVVTSANATLNSVAIVTGGTYSTSTFVTNYKLWYNSSNAFGAATQLGTTQTGVATGGTVTFGSLTQSIANGATGYFWVTADVSGSATLGQTVNIAANPTLTFASGTPTGSISAGGAQTFIGLTTPVITSPTAASISNTTATLGANVTSDGGATISARGVVWAVNTTNSNPTIGGTGCTNVVGTGTTGVFTVAATGLPAGTVISYRGYATNSQGTAYTTATTFTTLENASKLAFGTSPPSTGSVFTNLTAFTVLAQRTDNSTDNTYTGNITISKVSGSGTISGTLTVAAVAGVATFSAVQFNVADTYTIKASATGLTNSPNSGNITINTISSSATDQFRSATSGNWNSVATWQSFSSGVWVSATLVPSTSAASVTILSGHTVLGAGSFGACPLTIQANGGLLVDPSGIFTLCNTGSADLSISSGGLLSVAGVMINQSNTAISNSGVFTVISNGVYNHAQSATSMPNIPSSVSWDPNSTISVTGWTSSSSSLFSSSTNYGNVVWDCPNQTATVNSQSNLINVKGNLIIKNTGSSANGFRFANSASATVSIGGSLIITGGILQFGNSSGTTGAVYCNNFSVTGGTFDGSPGNTSLIVKGDVFVSTSTGIANNGLTNLLFNGSGNQTIYCNGNTLNVRNFDCRNKNAGNLVLSNSGGSSNINVGNTFWGIFTDATNNAFIDNGNTITLSNNLNMDGSSSGYKLTGTIILNSSSGTLNIRNTDGVNPNQNIVAALNNLTVSVTGAGSPAVQFRPATFSGTSFTTVTILGNLNINTNPTNSIDFGANMIYLRGDLNYNSSTDKLSFSSVGGIVFSGTTNQTYSSSVSGGNKFGNIIISNPSVVTFNNSANLNQPLTQGLVVNAGSTLNLTSNQIKAAGASGILNVSISGILKTSNSSGFSGGAGTSISLSNTSVTLGSNSIVDYNGTGSQVITNQIPYQNLLISAGSKTPAGNYSVIGNHSITGGSLSAGANLISFGGNWYDGVSGFSKGTSTVNWIGSGSQTLVCAGGCGFYALSVSGVGTLNLSNDVQVFGGGSAGLYIGSGVLDAGLNRMYGSSTAFLNISGGLFRTANTSNIQPDFAVNPYINTGGTIELYGSGNQLIRGGRNYYNLIINSSSITSFSAASPIDVLGTVSIIGTAILDVSNNSFGSAATNLFMSGSSLFRTSGTGTKPNIAGNYTLGSNTKIEFYNSLSTLQQIRSKVYANIDVTGSSVGQTALTGGDITISGGNFNVFPNAKFSLYGQSVKGSGSFIVQDNATFYFDCYGTDGNGLTSAANSGTIQTSSKSFSSNATYGFVGTSACPSGLSTGDLFPTIVGDLYSEKSAYPVKLTNNLTVNGTFTFATVAGAATAIDISGKNLIVNGSIGGVSTGVTFASNNSSGFYISNASGPKLVLPSFVSTLSGLFQVDRLLGIQLTGPLTLNGMVDITAGGIDLNGNSLALNGATYVDQSIINGAGAVSSNAYFRTSNINGFSGNGATIPMASVTLGSGSIVEFTNSSTATLFGTNISTPNNFQSVILSGSGTTYLPSDFNLGSNGYLSIGSLHSLDTKGDSYLVPTGVTVTVGGTLISANANGISGFSGSTFSSTNSPKIYPISGSTINYNGDVQSISSDLVYQNIIFNGTGPKVFPSSPNVLKIQGDITNNLSPSTSTPSFTYGTSTVSLTGSNAQSILGNGRNSFYNLVIDKTSNAVTLGASSFMNEVAGILTIKSGSSTALYTNDKLTLVSTAAGTVSALYAGSLIDLNSSANSGGSVSGNVVVQRAAVGGPSNRAFYMSMPVSGNLDQMQSVSTNYYFYNETKTSGVVSTGSRSQLWEKVTTPSSVSNSPGRAYSYRFKTRTTAPKGIVYNGTFDVSVSNTGQFTTSTTNNGWNLIGNPYPSPIDLDEVGDDPNTTNIAGSAFYVWDGEKYCIWSSLLNEGTNMSSSIIGSMQGFFVRAINNGNVRFTNNARTSGEADNKQFYRINGNNLPKIGLSISDGSKSDEVKFVVYDQSDASGAFDVKSDALKVVSLPATVPYLYANKSSLPTSIFTIPSLSSIERIPLSVISVSDSNHTFSVTKIQNFDPSVSVYLEDKELGVLQDLNVNPNYTTRIAKGTQSGRFSLVFRSSVVTNTFNKVGSSFKMYANDSKLIIESNLENSVTVDLKVFDVTGKLIVEKSGFELIPKLNEVQLGQLVNGVYSVHLISDSKMETEKILLINY